MRARRLLLFALGVAMASPGASASPGILGVVVQQIVAQQETSDPLLAEVNAELNRLEAEAPPPAVSAGPAEASRGWLYYLRALSALCLIIAAILALGYAARRVGSRTPLLAGRELGRVLGRLYLSRMATLYFVETGGKVLVVGVAGQTMATLGEFDAQVFSSADENEDERPAFDAESFLSQLEASSRGLRREPSGREDDDMHSLRKDIERLQDYLKDESREPRD